MESWEEDLIGKEVSATMNGVDFFKGVLEDVEDFFVPYKVRLDSGQLKYFISVSRNE